MSGKNHIEQLHAELFKRGLEIRRAVVGSEYVTTALNNGSNTFARPQQELVTEWCWGNIWTRPGLELKQRRYELCLFCFFLQVYKG